MLHSNVGSRWPIRGKNKNNITKQMITTNWKTLQRVGGVGDKFCAKAVPVVEEIYQSLAAALSFWWVGSSSLHGHGLIFFFFFFVGFVFLRILNAKYPFQCVFDYFLFVENGRVAII